MKRCKPMQEKSARTWVRNFHAGWLACLTAMTFQMNLAVFPVSEAEQASVLASLANLFFGLTRAMNWNQIETMLSALPLFWLYKRYLVNERFRIGDYLLGSFLALWLLLDRSILSGLDSVSVLWLNHTQRFKSLLCFVGFLVLCLAAFRLLERTLEKMSLSKPSEMKNPFAVSFGVLLASYMLCAVIRYPGVLLWDTLFQLGEFFGERPFLAMNPPVYTALCGWFAMLGDCVGKPEAGLFVMVLMQLVALAAVCSYFVSLLQQWRAPAWLVWLVVLLSALSPMYTSYGTTISKDSAYAVSMLLFLIQTSLWALEPSRFDVHNRSGIGNWIGWMAAGGVSIWMRKNGLYAVGLTAIFMCVIALFRCRGLWGRILPFLCTVLMLLVSIGVEKWVLLTYQVGEGSVREILSVPFQQTAIVLRERGDEVPQNEWEIIDKVLDADVIGEAYLPNISDPVKATYRSDATTAELADYFKVWLKQMGRYPDLYLDATMGLIHSLFSPFSHEVLYQPHNRSGIINGWDVAAWYLQVPFHEASVVLFRIWHFISRLPVIALAVNMGLYCDLFLGILLLAVRKKIKGFFLCSLPVLIAIVFLAFSPVCYTRYALPIYYGVPVLLSLYVVKLRSMQTQTERR